jgi:hypothetical protein
VEPAEGGAVAGDFGNGVGVMSVEQLIERLQTMPSYYEVKAFCPGVEVRDMEEAVVAVAVDPSTKSVLLEFTPTPGLQTGMKL